MKKSPVLNYDLHKEKRIIQKSVFPLITQRKIVCLAGPNLESYISLLPTHLKSVEIWEREREVMLKQIPYLQTVSYSKNISYRFGDIINAEADKNCFYDLDFCCSILSVTEHVKRFKGCSFMLTVSIRPLSLCLAIDTFLSAIGEKLIREVPHPQFNLLQTNRSTYFYTTYCDRTPMLTIFC